MFLLYPALVHAHIHTHKKGVDYFVCEKNSSRRTVALKLPNRMERSKYQKESDFIETHTLLHNSPIHLCMVMRSRELAPEFFWPL